MLSLYEKIEDADWNFEDWQVDAIYAGAEACYRTTHGIITEDLDDFKQAALLYAATHRQRIDQIETPWLLKTTIMRALVQSGRRNWEKERMHVEFDNEELNL